MSPTVGLCLVTVLIIWISRWMIKRWRNPSRTNGVLPPGSGGLPLIGETLHLVIPSYSLDLHPFMKTRFQRYGPIFRTNIVGRPVVMSADPEFNNYIIQQEGKLVELWYLETFCKVFAQGNESPTSIIGAFHKYARTIVLNHFGVESLREKLIPQIEECVNKSLSEWSMQASVEMKHAASVMLLNFSAKKVISYDAERWSENLSEKYTSILEGLMSLPLNIPGTKYYESKREQEKVVAMLRDMLKKRRTSQNEMHQGDFLDHISKDLDKEKCLNEDLAAYLIFGILLANFESLASAVVLVFKLLSEHPLVVDELIAEQEAILKNRKDPNSPLTWEEYKSMTFTLQVINETLRLGNGIPGALRRAMKDISVKGFTIPAGWTIMLVPAALHLNPDIYKNPLEFNPWRWKGLEPQVVAKTFSPFGGGIRQCVGSEYSRVFLAILLHVLLTKYRWTKIKGGKVYRNPILGFGDGIRVKFSKK